MKSLVGKLGVLVLLAAASSAVVAGCSSSAVPGAEQKAAKEGSQGEVTLGLLPVTGVALNSVHYTVVNATGGVVSEGDLPTPGDAKDISFGLSLPVGSGYTIALSAASADPNDNVTCGGRHQQLGNPRRPHRQRLPGWRRDGSLELPEDRQPLRMPHPVWPERGRPGVPVNSRTLEAIH